MGIACVSRNAFSRLPLRTVGKRRTAFLSRPIFAAHNFALDKDQIQSCRMQIDHAHLPESHLSRAVASPEAYSVRFVWLTHVYADLDKIGPGRPKTKPCLR